MTDRISLVLTVLNKQIKTYNYQSLAKTRFCVYCLMLFPIKYLMSQFQPKVWNIGKMWLDGHSRQQLDQFVLRFRPPNRSKATQRTDVNDSLNSRQTSTGVLHSPSMLFFLLGSYMLKEAPTWWDFIYPLEEPIKKPVLLQPADVRLRYICFQLIKWRPCQVSTLGGQTLLIQTSNVNARAKNITQPGFSLENIKSESQRHHF